MPSSTRWAPRQSRIAVSLVATADTARSCRQDRERITPEEVRDIPEMGNAGRIAPIRIPRFVLIEVVATMCIPITAAIARSRAFLREG